MTGITLIIIQKIIDALPICLFINLLGFACIAAAVVS